MDLRGAAMGEGLDAEGGGAGGVIIASCAPNESPKVQSPLSSCGVYKRARKAFMPGQKPQCSCGLYQIQPYPLW